MTSDLNFQIMDSQKFCLKWDGFQGSVTSVFDHLRMDSELVDVTLCCEGQRVRAHRMMLSACSPYFRELFKVRDQYASCPMLCNMLFECQHIPFPS